MRAIDADRLLSDRMKSKYYHLPNGDIAIPLIDIENAPTIEPRRGQWIKRKGGALGYNCSCCGKSDISNHFNYCPNCGADMREVNSDWMI